MAETTGIDWTDHTFNPWWGCTKVSEDCWGCYAERDSKRYGFDLWGPSKPRRTFTDKHWQQPEKWNAQAVSEGRKHRVFCASMADVFDVEGPAEERERLFALIRRTPMIDWQLLTKRPAEMKDYLNSLPDAPLPNVWAIVSAGNQERLDRFAPVLREVKAVVRGISWEPSLGPISIAEYPWLNWVIGGDESGPKARPAQEDWYRSVRDETQRQGIAFFLKQFIRNGRKIHTPELDGAKWTQYPLDRLVTP